MGKKTPLIIIMRTKEPLKAKFEFSFEYEDDDDDDDGSGGDDDDDELRQFFIKPNSFYIFLISLNKFNLLLLLLIISRFFYL